VLQVVSELSDCIWAFLAFKILLASGTSTDDGASLVVAVEQQFTSLSVDLRRDVFSQLDQRFAAHDQRMATLIADATKNILEQLQHESTSIPSAVPQPPSHSSPIHISSSHLKPTPQKNPNFLFQEGKKFQPQTSDLLSDSEGSRRAEKWQHHDQHSKWQPPHLEISKFDGSGIIVCLEDCEYYFDLYNTPKQYKDKVVIQYLVGDAREWHRYFKMHNSDPPWPQFKDELLDQFNPELKKPSC
jgi:hypothetical protein